MRTQTASSTFLRRGAPVGDSDRNELGFKLGKDFLIDARDRHESHRDDDDHQQVGNHAVVGEPIDQRLHRLFLCTCVKFFVGFGNLNLNLHAIDRVLQRGNDNAVAFLDPGFHENAVSFEAEEFDLSKSDVVGVVDDQNPVRTAKNRSRQDHDPSGGAADDLGLDEHADRQGRAVRIVPAGVRIFDAGDGVNHAGARVDLAPRFARLSLSTRAGGRRIRIEESLWDLGPTRSLPRRHGRPTLDSGRPTLNPVSVAGPRRHRRHTASRRSLRGRRTGRRRPVPAGPSPQKAHGQPSVRGRTRPAVMRPPQTRARQAPLQSAAPASPAVSAPPTQQLPFFHRDGCLLTFGLQPEFRLSNRRLRPRHGKLVVTGIEPEQHVLFFEETPDNERFRDVDHAARHLGCQLAHGSRCDSPFRKHAEGDVGVSRLHRFHEWQRYLRHPGFRSRSIADYRDGRVSGARQDQDRKNDPENELDHLFPPSLEVVVRRASVSEGTSSMSNPPPSARCRSTRLSSPCPPNAEQLAFRVVGCPLGGQNCDNTGQTRLVSLLGQSTRSARVQDRFFKRTFAACEHLFGRKGRLDFPV